MDIITGNVHHDKMVYTTIDTEKVVKKWNRLWCILEEQSEHQAIKNHTLIKYKRFDSEIIDFSYFISRSQAIELMNKLHLSKYPKKPNEFPLYWRRKKDVVSLKESRDEKWFERLTNKWAKEGYR